MNQSQKIEAEVIIKFNTEEEAINQLIEAGIFTSANKAKKYIYYMKVREKR